MKCKQTFSNVTEDSGMLQTVRLHVARVYTSNEANLRIYGRDRDSFRFDEGENTFYIRLATW